MDPVTAAEPLPATADDAGNGAGPLVSADDLRVYFPIFSGLLQRRAGDVRAVDDISLRPSAAARRFGLVGESGCGKSTTGRAVIRLRNPTERRRSRSTAAT